MHSTRASKKVYEKFELSEDDHKRLCDSLACFRGKVIVSGYDSELYNHYFANWTKVSREIVNHSSQSKTKEYKTEILWRNFTD
jgi:DNA adenine methylase